MRILVKDVKHSVMTVLPVTPDDFWVLFNIIKKGDRVYTRTTRQIKVGERYDRPEKGKRISVHLGLTVDRIFWDHFLNRLRINGIIFEAPDSIGKGSHHTFNINLNKPVKIVKDKWMKYELDYLERSCKRKSKPLIVLAIDDEGYCLALLRDFGVNMKAEKSVSLPGKRDAEKREKTIQEMFISASRDLEETQGNLHSNIVLLGLGFIKNQFIKYLEENNPKLRASITDVKSVNNIGKSGISEALRSGILAKAQKNLRVIEEAGYVEEVLRRLGKSSGNVAYGLSDVEYADTLGAVEKLLVTDTKMRESSDVERQNLEQLIWRIESKKGKVVIISTENEGGRKLTSLGGIAALLRFPLTLNSDCAR